MDLARGSKVCPPWNRFENQGRRTPIRLQSFDIVTALTTPLARPQVDTMGIELHEEDILEALVGVPVQGAARVACHKGIAIHIHLRQLASWALQCAADAQRH